MSGGWARWRRLLVAPGVRLLLWGALSGLLLYLVLREVRLGDVWSPLVGANRAYLGFALGGVALTLWGKAVRWQWLLGPARYRGGLVPLLQSLLIGQTLNLVPARLGDLSRAYLVGGLGPGRSFVLGTILVEKLCDLWAYVVLFLVLLLFLPMPEWARAPVTAFVVSALVALCVGLLLAQNRPRLDRLLGRRLPAWLPSRWRAPALWAVTRLRRAAASLDEVDRRRDLLRVGLLSVAIWMVSVLINQCVLLALGLQLPWTAALLVWIVVQVGISLTSVPGTIGVFEYLCYLSLTTFGVERALGLSYGILLHVVVLVPTTLLGIALIWIAGLPSRRVEFYQG